jgi:hypothetical protein
MIFSPTGGVFPGTPGGRTGGPDRTIMDRIAGVFKTGW